MHTGQRYDFVRILHWSRWKFIWPAIWAFFVTLVYVVLDASWMALPWLPMSLVGIAVAFYLGFKNNAAYDRLWEARKIWGAIVNASRTWAFCVRDLIQEPEGDTDADMAAVRRQIVRRHIAWMDALRFQLRRIKSWEHDEVSHNDFRFFFAVPEYRESFLEQLQRNLPDAEAQEAFDQINPAARLLSNQSRQLALLRRQGCLDGFSHMRLQELLEELMTQQGKAERIKNFPLPRQYVTINSLFAWLFILLLPFGMLHEFSSADIGSVWLTVPFSALVGWVFLTADLIGDWSENPFEGLANDVPISAMSRGIERDMLQMLDETELPPARKPVHMLQF